MNVHEFLLSRPCLEEIEGYLLGLRIQRDLGMDCPEIDADILKPIEVYKARLLKGKEVPAPSTTQRDWKYQQGRKPQWDKKMAAPPAKVLDLNKR